MISLPIQLIGLDLDGTLLGTDSCVHARERDTLQRARQAGVSVAITTGRSLLDALPHAEAAGGVDWLITENGARITSASGETIFRHPLTKRHTAQLLQLCERHGVEPSLYGEDCVWYGAACRGFFRAVSRILGRDIPLDLRHYTFVTSRKEWHALSGQLLYKAVVYGDTHKLDAWLSELRRTAQYEAEPSVFCGLKNIEINAAGTDKGSALLYLTKHLGLSREQVMACGDSDNDRTMLSAAGLGVAMGNAPQHIRAQADAVTESNENHGVSRAVERFVLQNV